MKQKDLEISRIKFRRDVYVDEQYEGGGPPRDTVFRFHLFNCVNPLVG